MIPGSKVECPYEIVSLIGSGGMGEVFLARDPRLGRDVAIKTSGAQFTERFDREVRAVAALNHPNICQVYDVGPNYLVMEFVEGESPRGPLPEAEALRICRQIAAALEDAHAKGIVHRNLKPANIKVKPDGTVKVLDFGLAKLMQPEGSAPENSPTLSIAATQAGIILGTAAYMSPEQARGKVVDKRADIWAFGVVLCELVTGDRLFTGDTIPDTLIEVATKEPDWTRVPASLLPLLRRCLEKDPNKRLRDLGDIDLLLDSAAASGSSGAQPAASSSRGGSRAGWAVAVIALAAASVIGARRWLEPAPPVLEVSRFGIQPPPKTVFDNALLVSPDGRKVVFTTNGEGGNLIWVRSLDTLDARVLSPWGSNPVPFWSHDSRFVAFQHEGKLKKVDIAGGPPLTLCDAPLTFAGGAWNADDVIVFGDRAGPLRMVRAAGGVPTTVTALDAASGETSHALPTFLSDGKHFLYLGRSAKAELTGVHIGSIDAKPGDQSRTLLVASPAAATYASGYALFLRETTLMAQPFDEKALALTGEPVPVADGFGVTTYGFGRFSASTTGTLAYRASAGPGYGSRLVWYDRQGKQVDTIGGPGSYNSIALSPDGKRLAVERMEQNGSDLWLYDTAPGGKAERFTFDPPRDAAPIWSRDGATLLFSSFRDGPANLYQKPSNGAGTETALFKSIHAKVASDWSPDGNTIVFLDLAPTTRVDLLTIPARGDGTPASFLSTPFSEADAKISPDGRWLAYSSNETARYEIYVRPFPSGSTREGKFMISTNGGEAPLWRRDGKELFYLQGGTAMVVEVDGGGVAFTSKAPKVVFDANPSPVNFGGYPWDVTADGKKFIVRKAADTQTAEPFTLVLNWTSTLRK